jgi:phosphoribosylanthranilate isomerase
VKICGITTVADALAAVEAGADALGFVFCAASPRCVSPREAAVIIEALPPFVSKVGLFVNSSEEEIRKTCEECALDTLQLHGDEPPEFCTRFPLKVIKAFRIRDASSLDQLQQYASTTWLLDSYMAGKLGGTGERFNWDLACQATRSSARLILAGGLTPDNVAEAVAKVRPYAVDVSSGVELKPGRKDPLKVKAFVRVAKAVDINPR